MLEVFSEYKSLISDYIDQYLDQQHQSLKDLNRWGEDSPPRLKPFVNSGKLIRGGLSLMAAEMYGADRQTARPLGAAMEFFQSAFLIHDDIMDQDQFRRGKKSLYFQYQELAHKQHIREDLRAGQSLGICLGDVAFFWAYDLLNRLDCEGDVRHRILSTASQEYVKVGLAQMEDVYFGFMPPEATEQEILKVYRYKTARYTFSLPLMLGAVYAGAARSQIDTLADLGEHMGIIFQIKDDELGLFGDSRQTGKPVGNDIIEGKKTLFRLYLMQEADEGEKEALNGIFGNAAINENQVQYVQDLILKKGIDNKIEVMLQDLAGKSRMEIKRLDIDVKYKKIFYELLEYSLGRKK